MDRETMINLMERKSEDYAHRIEVQYRRPVDSVLRNRHRGVVREKLMQKMVAWETLRVILQDKMRSLSEMVSVTRHMLLHDTLDEVERNAFTQFVRMAEGDRDANTATL